MTAPDVLIDHDTITLDAELCTENQLRAQLAAAIADNHELQSRLTGWMQLARKWEQRATQWRQKALATEKPTEGHQQ